MERLWIVSSFDVNLIVCVGLPEHRIERQGKIQQRIKRVQGETEAQAECGTDRVISRGGEDHSQRIWCYL